MTPGPSRQSSSAPVVPATTRDGVLARLAEVADCRRSFALFRDYQNREVGQPIISAGDMRYFMGVMDEMLAEAWGRRLSPPNGRRKWPYLLLFGSFLESFSLTESQTDFESALNGAVKEFAEGKEGGLPIAASLAFSVGWLRINRENFAKVEKQVQTVFRIARRDRPLPEPARRSDLERKPDQPEGPPERRRRGRPPVVEITADTRAAAQVAMSPLNQVGSEEYPKIAEGIRDLYRPLIRRAEAFFRQIGGKGDFRSYAEKLAFAQEVQRWLEDHHLYVVCPVDGCNLPAFLRCRKISGTKHGAFVFEHIGSHDLHYGSTVFPTDLRVQLAHTSGHHPR